MTAINLICESSSYNNDISLAGGGTEDNSIPVHKEMQHDNILTWARVPSWSEELKRQRVTNWPQRITWYLSMSYLGAAMCIISTAQQASPKVRGHREPFLHVKLWEWCWTWKIVTPAPVDKVINPRKSPFHFVLFEVHLKSSWSSGAIVLRGYNQEWFTLNGE